MRKFLSRVGISGRTPNYTESWNPTAQRIELLVPFTTIVPDNAMTAQELSNRVIAAVNDVQQGKVGSSLPEDVTESHVAIIVQPQNRVLGDLEEQSLEIVRERLGSAIALEVTDIVVEPDPAPAPPVKAEVLKPDFSWDAKALTFKGRMPAPSVPPTSAATHIRKSFDRLLSAVGTDKVQDLAPAAQRADARYEITVVLPRGTQWDQRCSAAVAKIEDALIGTKVTFRVENA